MSDITPAPAAPQPSPLAGLAQRMLAEVDSTNPEPAQAEPPKVEAEASAVDASETPATESPEGAEGQPEVPELEEVEFEGEKFQIPAKLKKGVMLEADYRKKTAELGDQRRTVETSRETLGALTQQAQAVMQQVVQFAPVLGQVASLDGQIESITKEIGADPNMKFSDPMRFNTLVGELFLVHQQRDSVVTNAKAQAAKLQQEMTDVNAKANSERQVQAWADVRKAIPDIDEQKARAVGEYAAKSGLPREALAFMGSSAPAFLLAWKASEFDRIQAETKVSLKKVEGLPPAAKPSAKTQTSESRAKTEKLREQFRASGGKDAALSRAILAERLGIK